MTGLRRLRNTRAKGSRRAAHASLPLGPWRIVLSFRHFTTPAHRRSKRFRQWVFQPWAFLGRALWVREVALALRPRTRHMRHVRPRHSSLLRHLAFPRVPGIKSGVRLTDQAVVSLLFIAAGAFGSLYFGTHLETRPDLSLPAGAVSSQPATLQANDPGPAPKLASDAGEGLKNHAGLRLIRPVSAVSRPPSKPAAPKPQLPKVMARSTPLRIRIPKINIDTSILPVGIDRTKSIAMPDVFDQVGWYDKSPTPGERGPAVIAGHVDSPHDIAIFWRLRELLPGDVIQVTRQDGTTATFRVTAVKQFLQNEFPTKQVYGNINYAGIRLITCGGTFSTVTGHYDHNTVVYGRLQE